MHLAVSELGQRNHPVQHRFELRIQHFLADGAFVVEQHGLDHLRFVLHARLPYRPSPRARILKRSSTIASLGLEFRELIKRAM